MLCCHWPNTRIRVGRCASKIMQHVAGWIHKCVILQRNPALWSSMYLLSYNIHISIFSVTNDRNVVFTYFLRASQNVQCNYTDGVCTYQRVWCNKPKQAEKETRRRDETAERLKVYVCCLSQLSFLLVADTLYTERAEFIRSAVGDWWCGFLEANTNSSQKLQACFLVNFVLGRMEHHMDKHLDPGTLKMFFYRYLNLYSGKFLLRNCFHTQDPNCALSLWHTSMTIYHLHHIGE